MTCGSPARSRLATAAAMLLVATPLAAQGLDAGVGALVTTAEPVFAGAGAHLGWRPGRHARIVLAGALGSDGEVAGRVEVMAQLLAPVAEDAPLGAYVGAGIGLRPGVGDGAGEVLLLVAGVETSPRGRGGAFVEAGVGGGARLAAGWRWRWLRGLRRP